MEDNIIIQNGIKYIINSTDYNNNRCVSIDDIFLEENITIPSIIYNKNNHYFVDEVSYFFQDNIKYKNISYFDIKLVNGKSYLNSINGIIYNTKYTPVAVPPQLKLANLYLPNETNSLLMSVFNTNSYIKRIYVSTEVKKLYIESGMCEKDYKYNEEIIYKNKIIKKINNSWKII